MPNLPYIPSKQSDNPVIHKVVPEFMTYCNETNVFEREEVTMGDAKKNSVGDYGLKTICDHVIKPEDAI